MLQIASNEGFNMAAKKTVTEIATENTKNIAVVGNKVSALYKLRNESRAEAEKKEKTIEDTLSGIKGAVDEIDDDLGKYVLDHQKLHAEDQKATADFQNATNILAGQVKQLIIAKNKFNGTLWKIIIGVIIGLLIWIGTVKLSPYIENDVTQINKTINKLHDKIVNMEIRSKSENNDKIDNESDDESDDIEVIK